MDARVRPDRVERGGVEPGGARPRVALVLGAGGARGLAHVGVIQALEARGYEIAAIAGTSMGALVGAMYAAGKLDEYRAWAFAHDKREIIGLLDFAYGQGGLFKGERIIGALREMVGDIDIESLPLPYVAVATDIQTQRELWLTRGSLFDAVRASIAIPGIFTPITIAGRELVDGGLLDPLPIAATRHALVDLVVAVDVNARSPRRLPGLPAEPEPEPEPLDVGGGPRARMAALLGGLLERRRPGEPPRPGMLDLMLRSLDTMQGQISRLQAALDPPDVLVRVPRTSANFYEFWRARELAELGERIAGDALDALVERGS
ncbi:patatin-like phospholipase family protein [Coralloluteibacterium stylophorae]|uniref:Patatin-like phospholipase family protein n=1 Tax=Coralloluteibacterium stylophorae TaxID=1776034 RepID=A0A8J7VSC2_9GAMM|nr:patatin-like phospholipase family protein [Coralloluteibacterium stylophorae]MBS7458822.1 patatin-like phospholipase family protein [Coralloluteibacterium stylophorae]